MPPLAGHPLALAKPARRHSGRSLAGLALDTGEAIRGADAISATVPYVRRVRGSVLGLVGLGRIGSAVALRAKACGFDVAFYDPAREDGADKALGIRRVGSLEALLAEAECVSLHCLCDQRTAGIIGARALDVMRAGALLVNTARGELIDEALLAAALRSGRLAAAALDVHCHEPYVRGEVSSSGSVLSDDSVLSESKGVTIRRTLTC